MAKPRNTFESKMKVVDAKMHHGIYVEYDLLPYCAISHELSAMS
jgi:hypothetical protein